MKKLNSSNLGSGMQFITGATGSNNNFAIMGQQENTDDSPVDLWTVGFWSDGDWRAQIDLDFNPVALCAMPGTDENWAILGSNSEILGVSSALSDLKTNLTNVDSSNPVSFTSLCRFRGGLTAAQLGRKVYWSDGGTWHALGTGLAVSQEGKTVGFEAMVALGDQLYGVGWQGEIWWIRDQQWSLVDSPVNTILTSVALVEDEIIACGRLGIILRGKEDRWEIIDQQQTTEDFWSVVTFNGRIYISSMTAIYELREEKLYPVDDDSLIGSYYHLSANDQILISIGARSVMMFDGDRWQSVI